MYIYVGRRNQINRRRLLEDERRQRQQRQQQQQAQCDRIIFALRAFNCLPVGVTSTGYVLFNKVEYSIYI